MKPKTDPVSRLWTDRFTLVPPVYDDSYIPGFTDFRRKPLTGGTKVKGRISFSTITKTAQENGMPVTEQIIKFFCSPSVDVVFGSHLIEVDGSQKHTYKCAGVPARYTKHQEIVLEHVSSEAV